MSVYKTNFSSASVSALSFVSSFNIIQQFAIAALPLIKVLPGSAEVQPFVVNGDQYDSLCALAQRLIDKKGRPIVIEFMGLTNEVKKSERVAVVKSRAGMTGVIFDQESKSSNTNSVKETNKVAYIAARSAQKPPDSSDYLVDLGVRYAVDKSEVIGPGDQSILYIVRLRA